MNSSDKNTDRLAHKIREAMEHRQENANDISAHHIAAMRFWEVCSGVNEWSKSEKAHLDGCVRCRTRENRVRATLSDPGRQAVTRNDTPVIEINLLAEGGLVTGKPDSGVTDKVCEQITLGMGTNLEVTLRRDARGAPRDELELTVECQDPRCVGRLLSLDMSGSEGVVNSFLMLAPGESGSSRSYRKWNTSSVSGQLGEKIELWLEEKSLVDLGVFESELLPEAARLADLEERRVWLAFAEGAMMHVSPSGWSEKELLSSFESSDWVLRMHATLVSGKLPTESEDCIRELIKRLADPEEAVRYAAVVSLGALKRVRDAEPFLGSIEDEPIIRRAVARALGYIDSEASTAALEKLLAGDPQVEVCESACQALGQLGSDAAVEVLFRTVKKSPNDKVRNVAYQALGKIDSGAGREAISRLRNERTDISLPDRSLGAPRIPAQVFAEEDLVPAFLLPALYGTAVAALSSPMDTLVETARTIHDRATKHEETSSSYSIALSHTDTVSTGRDGTVQKSEWPVREWESTDDARRPLAKIEATAVLLAEWSPDNQVLSVWLEGAGGMVNLLAAEWLAATNEVLAKTTSDTNGICELQNEHAPTQGDYLLATIRTAEGMTLRIEVVFPG